MVDFQQPRQHSQARGFFSCFWKNLPGLLVLLSLLCSPNTWAASPYSTRELDELEKEFVQEINQSSSVLRHPLAVQYINRLGRKLATHSNQPPAHFFIVKSNEINAFAGPGGHIGINTQLILASNKESELAGVMAHEMAHVRLHHLYRMLEHEKQMRIPRIASLLASIALGVINPALGSGALMASLTGLTQDNINFIRANEKEADRIGIDMLIKSGLDPRGMAGFFRKMQMNSRYYYTQNIPAILRTHPMDDDRIAEAENRTAHLPPKQYTESTEYLLVKELIRTTLGSNKKSLTDYYPHECKKHSSTVACQYGRALVLINTHRYTAAQAELQSLLTQEPNNLYFIVAMAQAEAGNRQFDDAAKRLGERQANSPDQYAITLLYGKSLVDAGQAQEATRLLLQASRANPNDLPMCQQLAQAYAANQQKGYAYFTQAQCELLQGNKRSALTQLKNAEKLNKSDHLLKARITAKIEEIQR